ncbi:MAG: hypothetical protein ACYCSQ_00500 [bacterium]
MEFKARTKPTWQSFLGGLKEMLKSFINYLKLVIVAVILSFMLSGVLLFIYIIEYGAPAMLFNYTIMNHAAAWVMLLTIPAIFLSVFASRNEFLFLLKATGIVMAGIFIWGIFATWMYSPQRIFLRTMNMGGKTVAVKINKKACGNIDGLPLRAYLVYKGNYMEYFKTSRGVEGINKECIASSAN